MKISPWLAALAFSIIIGCSAQPLVAPAPGTATRVLQMPEATPTVVALVASPAPTTIASGLPTRSTLSSTSPFATIGSSRVTQTPAIALSVPSQQTQATMLPVATTKTYTNTRLGIALDYPSDWTVSESADGAKFTSPQGATIDLALVDTQNQSPEYFLVEMQLPNTRCLNSANPHGVTVRNCLDTVSFSYNANLILKLSNNTTRLVSLTMRGKSPNPVFDAMIASVRITA